MSGSGLISRPSSRLLESGNPAVFAGFPNPVGKSASGLSSGCLFNSCSLCAGQDRSALAAVAPQLARPVRQCQRAVRMLVRHDRAAGQRAAPACLVDLQSHVLEADRVVAPHGALELQRKDQIRIAPRAAGKGRAPLCCRVLEARVELGHVLLAQEAVGLFHTGDAVQPQLPAAAVPARSRSCVPSGPAPAASRPVSSALPTCAAPVPAASPGADPPCCCPSA
jgi:hypothetical protein